MKIGFTFLILFLNFAKADIKGILFEKGKNIPLKNVNIYFPSENGLTTTNEKGIFILKTEAKEINIKINLTSFIPLDRNISESEENIIYLERKLKAGLQLTVEDKNIKKDQSLKSISRQQIFETPGANGDPVKAVQNLPGINRTQGFSSQVVIQGSAPKDTSYDFDDHEIPLVFHFGGISSVVMPEAVERVDYYSAGFQAERSRALGGIISLKTRDPEIVDRPYKGLFYLDNLSAGGLFESKISENSNFLISGRYSYIGAFLKAAVKDQEAFNLTVAPEFYDITGIYKYKISDKESFKICLLNSKDKLAFVFTEPVKQDPKIRGTFSSMTTFYRIIPSWENKINESHFFKVSLGYGKDQISVDAGENFFKLDSQNLTARSRWEYTLNSQNTINTGWDNSYRKSNVKIRLPVGAGQNSGGVSNPISSGETREVDILDRSNNIGTFLELDHQLTSDIKVTPGLRLDYFSKTKEKIVTPRLAASLRIDESLSYKFGSGYYIQNPEPQETSPEFGNPELRSLKALHVSLGMNKVFSQYRNADLTVNSFFKKYEQLIISSTKKINREGSEVFEIYNNDGKGYAFGIENQFKINFDQLSFNLSYTWSKSYRSSPKKKEYNFEFDQTHNINLITGYEFGNNWKLSSRFRFVIGNPYTPVIGSVYDSDNETYFPVRGDIYSERNKEFRQLDLRLDKKIIANTEIWTFYLDIQNVLSIKNPEGYQYSYDYSQRKEVMGLPVLPSVGVKGEF